VRTTHAPHFDSADAQVSRARPARAAQHLPPRALAWQPRGAAAHASNARAHERQHQQLGRMSGVFKVKLKKETEEEAALKLKYEQMRKKKARDQQALSGRAVHTSCHALSRPPAG
jgi:hypothetical protein